MADLENFKFLIVFGFEHHHSAIFVKYFVPKISRGSFCKFLDQPLWQVKGSAENSRQINRKFGVEFFGDSFVNLY